MPSRQLSLFTAEQLRECDEHSFVIVKVRNGLKAVLYRSVKNNIVKFPRRLIS